MESPSKALRPVRILVTGSSGFTGGPLMEVLRSRGHTVFGLTRTPSMAGELYGDIGDPTSIQIALAESAPQVVVHLAGITYPAHPSPAEIYDANVTGGVHLLSELAALKTPPELTIVASSATVYGTASGREIVEDDVLAPSSHYGVSKSALEAIAALYAGQMRIQITRPFNYTGPGQPTQFFVPKVVDHFARDAGVMEVGNLDLWRDISSLNDILEAYVRLIEGGAATSPLNLCSGQSVRLGDVIDMVAAISGRGLDIQVAKRFIRPGEPRNVVGSRAKLDATIGVWPRETMVSLLERMYAAALSNV